MFEFVLKIFTALQAPDEADAHAMRAWRRTVAAALMAILACGAFSFAWAQGLIWGLPGVATTHDVADVRVAMSGKFGELKGDVNSLRQSIDALQLISLRQAIEAALKRSCEARGRNQEAFDDSNAQLYGRDGNEGLLEQYRQLTHHKYDLRDCNTVLFTPNQ
jgi:hypothetical protein